LTFLALMLESHSFFLLPSLALILLSLTNIS
jgi:hypothetical protein